MIAVNCFGKKNSIIDVCQRRKYTTDIDTDSYKFQLALWIVRNKLTLEAPTL